MKAYRWFDLTYSLGGWDYAILEPLSLADGCRYYMLGIYEADDGELQVEGIVERTLMLDDRPVTCAEPELFNYSLLEGERRED